MAAIGRSFGLHGSVIRLSGPCGSSRRALGGSARRLSLRLDSNQSVPTRACTSCACSTSSFSSMTGTKEAQQTPHLSRRSALLNVCVFAAAVVSNPAADAFEQFEMERLKDHIVHDFVDNQYYITGNLTKQLYAPDCVFKDPTTTATGPEFYSKAVSILFDPQVSRADLISATVSGPNTVDIKWRLSGKLNIGGLPLKPYTGTTRYTVGADGLIHQHEELWDISVLDATISLFFPTFGAPPAPPV